MANKTSDTRTETDTMGSVEVPVGALWGPQTQRAVQNFPISGQSMPRAFISALGLTKWAAAGANAELGLLTGGIAAAIQQAALEVSRGDHDDQFPVDVFQTGSGTSSNMNANEVIARLASDASGLAIHPNDQVNMGQSSNDVIPTAMHVSACIEVVTRLLPCLDALITTLDEGSALHDTVVKTGRTHLMDAMPLTLGQEFSAWAAQFRLAKERFDGLMPRLTQLAQGGTAVGTGINAHPRFGPKVAVLLSERTGIAFRPADSLLQAVAAPDTSVELAAVLKTLAVAMMKLANDLRWMSSGPLNGLGEISLPALQPGSSIMPGKVNPVLPEVVAMVAASIIGNDATITVAGQSGNFQLNVMLPLIVKKNLESIELATNSIRELEQNCIKGIQPNSEHLAQQLARNPILVTALNSVIGYELGARIAKEAYQSGRSVREVALEMSDLNEDELDRLLNASELTQGGMRF